jgi:hypothetical protein
MKPDAAFAGETRDPPHLGEVEDFPGEAAYRRFDRDHPHRCPHAPRLGALDLGRSLLQYEARPLGCERDQGQADQLLRPVTRVVVDVAFPLHQHAAAALCKQAQRQIVGECAARQKNRRFLAQHRRHALFQLGDDAITRKLVGLNPALLCAAGKQACIVGRRERQAVGAEVHPVIVHRIHLAYRGSVGDTGPCQWYHSSATESQLRR